MADDGSCVIAGRSGFYIFRDHPNHLSILLIQAASMQHRMNRLIRKRRISAEEAREIITKVDRCARTMSKREIHGYFNFDTRNYSPLVINMDDHTEDEAVEDHH